MPSPSRKQLVTAHHRAIRETRTRVQRYTSAVWEASPQYRDDDIDRIVERITPAVHAGKRRIGLLTDSYLARYTGGKPVGVRDDIGSRGTPDVEVYRRPATTLYVALAAGSTYAAAQSAATARLSNIVNTDMLLALRDQSRETMTANKVERFSRVLSGSGSCDLCEEAALETYTSDDLMPIHPGCGCDVVPIIGDNATGIEMNEQTLSDLHPDGVPQREPIEVTNHGEYGPTLGWSVT